MAQGIETIIYTTNNIIKQQVFLSPKTSLKINPVQPSPCHDFLQDNRTNATVNWTFETSNTLEARL
jgi:hypothetical protein